MLGEANRIDGRLVEEVHLHDENVGAISEFCYIGDMPGCVLDINEPPQGKTNNLHMRKQSSNCEADQRLCFRNTDSTIPLLSKSKISSLYCTVFCSSVTVQAGLCRACSETTLLVFPQGSSNVTFFFFFFFFFF